ncbi:invasin [Escherichia coli]|uniref:Invasin n=1 Tax=Escherichia coli TaxID=562 RepID=A0A376THZ7_ECOLX|nr:invasin [Escherichia coli]
MGSKTWRNSAAEITNPQSLRYSATDLAGRYADIKFDAGAQANSAEGWTLIMPDWQNGERASNHWRLSVVVEDNQGQRVSSNEITLTLVEPFDALSNDELRWEP